ncbi:hypothetical protein FKM82_007544 [Ascaphus truei]
MCAINVGNTLLPNLILQYIIEYTKERDLRSIFLGKPLFIASKITMYFFPKCGKCFSENSSLTHQTNSYKREMELPMAYYFFPSP